MRIFETVSRPISCGQGQVDHGLLIGADIVVHKAEVGCVGGLGGEPGGAYLKKGFLVHCLCSCL